jgi:hypothetical protein
MAIITLTDIQRAKQQGQLLPKNNTQFTVDSIADYNFHLVMKQLFLKLPVQPLLNEHPQIALWVNQVKKLAPELFKSKRKILIDHEIYAPIILDNQQEFVHIFTNLGFKRGVPKLYEWAVRHPVLSWQDRVKLWATSTQYSLLPEKLELVVIAVHPHETAQKLNVSWNRKYHRQTEEWLMRLLNSNQSVESSPHRTNSNLTSLVNLDEIPEVKI